MAGAERISAFSRVTLALVIPNHKRHLHGDGTVPWPAAARQFF